MQSLPIGYALFLCVWLRGQLVAFGFVLASLLLLTVFASSILAVL
jgi:hypothetical protein